MTLVYRLISPKSDHYFVINDGPAKKVNLRTIFKYGNATETVTGEKIYWNSPIENS